MYACLCVVRVYACVRVYVCAYTHIHWSASSATGSAASSMLKPGILTKLEKPLIVL